MTATDNQSGEQVEVRFADFDRAANVLYPLEKGEAADDNGRGAVNFGITEYFMSLIGDKRAPSALTWEDAKDLYRRYYWEPWKLGKIHADRQEIADFLLACLINTSPQHVAMTAQRALNGGGYGLKADGLFGPLTLHAINNCNVPLFLWNFYHFMTGWYETLADRSRYETDDKTGESHIVKPNARFLSGWINRLKYLHKYSGTEDPPTTVPANIPAYKPKDPRK